MLDLPRAVILSGLVAVGTFAPRVVAACTPGGLVVRFLGSAERDLISPHAVFWFEMSGTSRLYVDFEIDPEIVGPDGVAVPLLVSLPLATSSQNGPSSSDRRIRVEAALAPNTAYTLLYNIPAPAYSSDPPMRATRQFTTGPAAEPTPPASPTAELAFADGEDDARLPLPCTGDDHDEVTIIMAKAPGARAIHARVRYADEVEFGHAITHVLQPGADGDTLFAWAKDRGIPCVELIAESSDGSRSAPTEICEAVGCVDGEAWFEALGRSAAWWREEHGPASCSGVTSADPARGCACMAVPEGRKRGIGVIAGLIVAMGLLRKPRRRSRSVVRLPTLLLITLMLATACGDSVEPTDAGEGLDASSADVPRDAAVDGDAGIRDAGPSDLGATACQVFCTAHAECLAARSRRDLEFLEPELHCTTEPAGLEGCATRCEAFNPSDACLECGSMCDVRCREVCPGLGLSDTQWPIWDHQTCWFGAPRPTESCTEPRSVTRYSGGASPTDSAETFFLEYSGTATVVSSTDRIVRTPSGLEFRLGIGIRSEVPVPTLELGSTVQVELRTSCSFWGCGSTFVLRDDAGSLLAAGWSGAGPMPIAELNLRYEGRSCLPLPREHYFELELELVAGDARIRMGQYAEVGDFYVFNGWSTRYYAITVTDTPLGDLSGVVVRKQ